MAEIKVITIGRHYCAGGSTIGKLVAEKLGIPCYAAYLWSVRRSVQVR